MEAYPPDYVELNLPLVFLSGLGERYIGNQSGSPTPKQGSGTRIVTTSPECEGDRAAQLLEQLMKLDGSQLPWNAAAQSGSNGMLKYRMKAIGRTFTLQPRKAAPLPQTPSVESFQSTQSSQHRSAELHSPLSPLSPGSPIYPDGVFTPLWIAKHQEQVPALLIAFFNITADDSTSQNEQIQIDINAIRTAVGRSGYKTRVACVLMSDRSILQAPELEDRLSAIRRATTLDSKSLLFMAPMSSQEIDHYVETILTPLQPLVLEYYRDLTKHARRKKARGGPAASITSPVERGTHALSTPGWNVRYLAKEGVFAEFRGEMADAERHYSAAIEVLFSSEGVLETTPSWSPRWSEARLLCDILALRTLRCQLWSGITTGAAVSWVNYHARTKDLVDRRSKGSQTYGWYAWEARWAEIMAQLIQKAALPGFEPPSQQASDDSTARPHFMAYVPLEKGLPANERLPPFHLLHHRGYWLRLAFQSVCARREKALAIPVEDRIPPGQSPASAVALRSKNYDTYLVPEPHEESPFAVRKGYDHAADLRRLATEASHEFRSRGQVRLADSVEVRLAHQIANAGRHAEALDILLPLWNETTWRDEDWDDLFNPLLLLAHECAAHTKNAEVRLATAWELLSAKDRPASMRNLEFAQCLGRDEPDTKKIAVKFENRQRLCPITISFAFVDKDTHVGEPVECQLTLTSHALEDSTPITLSRIQVWLSNSKVAVINHSPSASPTLAAESLLDLSESTPGATGLLQLDADLTLLRSQRRTYSFILTFREAGNVRLQQVALLLDNDEFALEHKFTDEDLMRSSSAYVKDKDFLEHRLLPHADTTAVTVHPKPPKMRVFLLGLREHYYTNERIRLTIELVNEEAETVNVLATVRVSEQADETATVKWDSEHADESELHIGSLDATASHDAGLTLIAPSEPCSYPLKVEISYTLESDSSTPLTKTLAAVLEISMPFEAKYDLRPLLHAEPWPSYFDVKATRSIEEPEGIPQKWSLRSTVHSIAVEGLVVRDAKLTVDTVAGDAICDLLHALPHEEEALAANQSTSLDFGFVTSKSSLDDRRPTNVELSLDITWSRAGDSAKVRTSIPVPQLSLPSSEPRVLCTILDAASEKGDTVLQYHLENPSMHFLTFALTMEANESFAFSGPKYRTLSLAPLSRLCVEYNLRLHDQETPEVQTEQSEGRWIWPVLQVVDSYYQKNLRVHSGGARVKVDDKCRLGILIREDA